MTTNAQANLTQTTLQYMWENHLRSCSALHQRKYHYQDKKKKRKELFFLEATYSFLYIGNRVKKKRFPEILWEEKKKQISLMSFIFSFYDLYFQVYTT